MYPRTDRWRRILSATVLGGLLVCVNGGPSSVAVAQSSPPPLTPFRGLIDHVSANSTPSGIPSAGAQSWPHSISGDGRYVVMESNAWDLVPNDFNSFPDIFLRDRQTGSTTRVSVAVDGGDADGMSQYATISSNGRQVAFTSGASNLVADDTNGHWDVFVRDLDRGRTVRVSVATDGSQGDADAGFPAISSDGRFVVFVTSASTLTPGALPYQPMQAYIHDRDANANGIFDEPGQTSTTLVSTSVSGGFADSRIDGVRVSGDGRFVVFESDATNLDPAGNDSRLTHLYLRDLQTNQTTLVDRAVTGGPSASGVAWRSADISLDGRYVTYASNSADIVPASANGQSQVFRYDVNAQEGARTLLVSALPDGTLGDGSSDATSVSADGRYIAFITAASNLAMPAPVSGTRGVVVRDMVDGAFTRVDVIETGAAFDHTYPYSPAISADGTAVALQSNAQNALNGAFTGGADHVFVATAFALSPSSASMPMAGGMGSIEVNTAPVSGWKATSFDDWITVTAGAEYGAGPRTVQYLVNSNDAGIARDGHIRVGSTTVLIHQDGDGDVTPPVITPTVTGALGGDGWYVGDVMVQWTVTDPESPITSLGYGCSTVTIRGDTIYAPVTCEATSHGGSTSNTVVIRSDTAAPAISITTPAPTIYTAGTTVVPSFTCADANGYSGVATCAISEGSTPLDTTPGRHVFTVSATDRAGNSGTKSVEYLVGTGACVSPNDSLKAWWRFEGNTFDALANLHAMEMPSGSVQYAPAVAGQGWAAQGTNFLTTDESGRLEGLSAMTVAAWVRPAGQVGESATIASNPVFRIARYSDGTLRWAFYEPAGFDWVNTGLVIPMNVWTHIAVSQNAGLVKTYVNGRLAHSHQLSGSPYSATSLIIGGRADLDAFFIGGVDELQVFGSALNADEIDAIALAGSGGLCLPAVTTLTVTVPPSVGYGATFPVTATLRDEAGNPIAGKPVTLYSYVSQGGYYVDGASGTTDTAGQLQVQLPMSLDATVGSYAPGVRAIFPGDAHDTPSQVDVAVTVVKGTPAITWSPLSSIVYGTALGSSQLNATAQTSGTFTYSPAPGTILDAGAHTLNVTFTPSDTDRWNEATATTALNVDKAVPTVTITGGTFTYDKLPHPGTGAATGVFGETLTPVQVLYNDTSQTPPVNAGSNWVSAYYAGSANYTSGSASNVPLVINKAVPSVTIAGGPFVFDGRAHVATVTIQGVGGDVLPPYSVLYDGSASPPDQAGSYTVAVHYNGDDNYESTTVNGTLVINKATPIVSLSDVTLTYDGQPHGVSVNVAGVNSDWLTPVVVTYNGSTTEPTNAGVYTIEARYDGSNNYNAISRTATLTILKAAPYLTWTTPASIVYGTALSAAQLNAVSNVPGTFTYTPSEGTVLNAGTHTLTASFTPADAVNYQAGSTNVSLAISKANPVLTWDRPQDIVYGTALGSAQLAATANVAGTFTYSPAAGTVLNAGTQILSATFTPDDAANYNAGGTVGAVLTVAKATPTITWSTPADITYGTALNVAQLNATASVPGTFSYSPAAGTVLSAGSHQLSMTFTPSDGANYNGSSATRTLMVTPAPLTVVANPASKPFGAPLPAFSVSTSDFVNGDSLASLAGTLSLSTPATSTSPVGTYPVTPQGLSSPNYSITFVAGTLTVVPASTAMSFDVSPNPSGANQPVTLTAYVSVIAPGAGVPSGAVQFFDGGTLLGTVSLAAGSAVLTTNGLAAGSHTLTATYSGDASFASSTGTCALTVNTASASSTTAVTSSANPATAGQNVTLTATVTASGTLSGNVEFYDLSVLLATVPLSGTTARLTTAGLASGGHAITARYLGNASIPPSTSAAFAQYVQPSGAKTRSSTVALVASPSPATLGGNVTLTATATGSNRQPPTGTVVFMLNGGVLGQATLGASGTASAGATLSTSTLPHGTHRVEAVYLGDATYRASTTSITLVVN